MRIYCGCVLILPYCWPCLFLHKLSSVQNMATCSQENSNFLIKVQLSLRGQNLRYIYEKYMEKGNPFFLYIKSIWKTMEVFCTKTMNRFPSPVIPGYSLPNSCLQSQFCITSFIVSLAIKKTLLFILPGAWPSIIIINLRDVSTVCFWHHQINTFCHKRAKHWRYLFFLQNRSQKYTFHIAWG